MDTTRSQHLDWCRARALEYVELNDPQNALASMMSDLSKHPETAEHAGLELGMRLMIGGFLQTNDDVRRFIDGFN